MWIDLHCHSTHSDGSEAPEVVAARAAERKVELFCLTDHDTCGGYAATLGACPEVLRGLELTCREDDRTVHILVYDVARDDTRWAALEAQLAVVREDRRTRLVRIVARLAQLGVEVDVEDVQARTGRLDPRTSGLDRAVGRPDVARALVAAGVVGTVDEAFRRYLGDGGPADVPMQRLSLAEGLALGRRAGGKMSLAHPHLYGDRAATLLQRHRDAGLDGLECYYGAYQRRQRRRWLALAQKLDLVVTGGSDFHGSGMPQIAAPGVELPEPHATRLCRWLEL